MLWDYVAGTGIESKAMTESGVQTITGTGAKALNGLRTQMDI